MAELKIHTLKAQRPAEVPKAKGQRKDSIWNREIELSPPFSSKEKQHFFHLLSVLLESGLSITESFEILAEQTTRHGTKKVIEAVAETLRQGGSLHDALRKEERHFSEFEIQSIRMGEAAGQMNHVLNDLAIFHEKRLRLRRKLSQALSYPVVVLVIAFGVMAFMLGAVVPMFQDVFKRFGAELPAITQAVIGLSNVFKTYGPFIAAVLLMAALAWFRVRRNPKVRVAMSAGVRRIPLLGKLMFTIQLSRFCYTLSVMLRSRVTLDQALALLEKITQYPPLQSVLANIRQDVLAGKMLHEAMARHKVFPTTMLQMARVGERTAKLDLMMEGLGKNLEEESEAGVTALTQLLEPLLIVLLGLIVGVILIAMYMPMFQLSQTFTA